MPDDQPSLRERADLEREKAGEQTADSVGIRSQHKEVSKRKYNPDFLAKLQEADIDTDKHPWLEDLLGPELSGAQILGNRERDYENWVKFGDENTAERIIAEGSPGRILADHPELHAFWQGLRSLEADKHPEYQEPIQTEEQKRQTRAGMEVATNRKTLAIDGKGIDSVATATTENRTVRNDEGESQSVREKLADML
jgi:hypothetical protein